MGSYKTFFYVFRLKSNVVVPHDYSQLSEVHYRCIHREPVAELVDCNPAALVRRVHELSLSPSWYKRGLKPLTVTDVVWIDGMGYMVIPTAAGCDYFESLPATRHRFGSVVVEEKQIDPEKILTCKA